MSDSMSKSARSDDSANSEPGFLTLSQNRNSAAYQVGQYVDGRARSAQKKKKEKRRHGQKLSLSPTRRPIRKTHTMEEAALETWRKTHANVKANANTTGRENKADVKRKGSPPRRHFSSDDRKEASLNVDSEHKRLARAGSKYVRNQGNGDGSFSSLTSSKPYKDDDPENPDDAIAKELAALEASFNKYSFDDVDEDAVAAQHNFNNFALASKKTQQTQKRKKRLCVSILLSLLLAGGVVVLMVSLLSNSYKESAAGSSKNKAKEETAHAATELPPKIESPHLTEPKESEETEQSEFVLQTEETTQAPAKAETTQEGTTGSILTLCARSEPAASQECLDQCKETECCWNPNAAPCGSDGDQDGGRDYCEDIFDEYFQACSFLGELNDADDNNEDSTDDVTHLHRILTTLNPRLLHPRQALPIITSHSHPQTKQLLLFFATMKGCSRMDTWNVKDCAS